MESDFPLPCVCQKTPPCRPAAFDVCILIDHRKIVVFGSLKVHQTNKCRASFATYGVVDLHAILQIARENAVLFNKNRLCLTVYFPVS